MEDRDIEKICKFAKEFKAKRGTAYLCFKDVPEEKMLIFVNFPDRISNVPNCIATHMFSTGHSTPDCYVKESEMYDCPNRTSVLQK